MNGEEVPGFLDLIYPCGTDHIENALVIDVAGQRPLHLPQHSPMPSSILVSAARRLGPKLFRQFLNSTRLSAIYIYRQNWVFGAKNSFGTDIYFIPNSREPPISLSPNTFITEKSNNEASDTICRLINGGGDLEELEANLNQSGIIPTPPLMEQVIHRCGDEAICRRILGFFNWCIRQPGCHLSDEFFNNVLDLFARKNDLKAMEMLVADMRREGRQLELKTFAHVTERLVRAGRDKEAVGLFIRLSGLEYQRAFRIVVCALCEKGFAERAETLIKHMKKKLPLDEIIFNSLIHGWCVKGNSEEARRVMEDMRSHGFRPGLIAYNSLLKCICKTLAEKDPSKLMHEGNNIVVEMQRNEVSPNQFTFNILISHLCKIRSINAAHKQFRKMEKCGCSPNSVTYVLLIKTMYLTDRLVDGDKMLDRMIEAGFKPDAKTFHSFIAVLCGNERVDHALCVLSRMEGDSEGKSKLFHLLIGKLCRSGQFDKAQLLWNEAAPKGLTLDFCPDLLDPTKTEVCRPVRKERKKLECDNKRAMKRKKTKILFVKKKKRQRQRRRAMRC